MAKKNIIPDTRIHRLDPVVSARIAAGEVIERPASALRELLDNALDSGADKIRVEAADGGRKLLQVTDNGCGMGAEDLKLSIEKHATSKIRDLEDLSRVVSLGFRGEALHAMATVSRLRILSSNGGCAMELCMEGGKELWFREAAGRRGTTVELSKLFFNTPARREFLKSAISEGRAVKREVLEKMLAWPDRGFEYYSDGKKVYSSPAGSLLDRIGDLYGREVADGLLEVTHEQSGMVISGYAGPLHRHASSRKDQFFFFNGRPVSTASLSHALRSAYGNLMPAGRQPVAFLNLAVDPSAVNVNIHPAKREVRFLQEQEVYSLIRRGVEQAVLKKSDYAPLPAGAMLQPSPGYASVSKSGAASAPVMETQSVSGKTMGVSERPAREESLFSRELPEVSPGAAVPEVQSTALHVPSGLGGRFAGMQIRTCLFSNYWLLEGAGELLLVDQHAAHERVLYEQYRKQFDEGGIVRQGLLVPLNLELTPGDSSLVEEHREQLQRAGFGIESFGPDSWVLQELPAHLKNDGEEAFRQLLALLAGNERIASDERTERMLTTLACRSAVKAGDAVPESMMISVLNRLDGLPAAFACPHGRPAVISISQGDVAKWFART